MEGFQEGGRVAEDPIFSCFFSFSFFFPCSFSGSGTLSACSADVPGVSVVTPDGAARSLVGLRVDACISPGTMEGCYVSDTALGERLGHGEERGEQTRREIVEAEIEPVRRPSRSKTATQTDGWDERGSLIIMKASSAPSARC